MIDIKDSKDCCGCNACGDICPTHAISFSEDKEGFLYPHIDDAKCVECGKCERICPVLRVGDLRNRRSEFDAFHIAAVSRNLETRFDSTSGGIFSELASIVLAKGGFVGGAVWTDSFGVVQIVTDDAKDLPRLRSSKYAQSDANGFYAAVKNALGTGKDVLVCGTPCQMVALRSFLGCDYDNLIIVDFICRGINSPLVMRKYIEYIERSYGGKVVAVKQKSKELGWHRLTTKFTFADGTVAYDPRETSLFMRGYLNTNVFCRPSCYACRFKGFPRIADITLADCWKASDSLHGVFATDLGNSLVMCNTYKGKRFFDLVKDDVVTAPVSEEEVLSGNLALVKSLPPPSIDRTKFFSELNRGGLEDALSHLVARPQSQGDSRSKFRKLLSRCKRLIKLGPMAIKLIRINGFDAVSSGKSIIEPVGRVLFDRAPSARVEIKATTRIGCTIYKHSSLESRFLLKENSHLISYGFDFSYGCDVELFKGARLEVGPGGFSNIGLTLICGKSIKFGKGVICGRHVTIRDTNGEHYLNRDGYQVSTPVEIGDHVWLCEGCYIMPGVTVGAGSVVAAGAVVTKDVPPNTLVAGVPARVVRSNVLWR